MKNVKRFLTLCLALCMALSVAAFAEGEPGTIKEITADGAVYEDGGVNFELTYEDATNNGMYLILVLSEEGTPKDGNILYVNQVTADEDGAYFENVYPTEIGEETSYIYIAGPEGYKSLGEIIPNVEEVVPPPAADVIVNPIGVSEDAYSVDGRIVTVEYDYACKVFYEDDQGEYVAIAAEENGDGGYDFVVPDAIDEVTLVVKGDVNGNGIVNTADTALINRSLLLTSHPAYKALTEFEKAIADVNANGTVNTADTAMINRSLLLSSHPAYQLLAW